MRYVVVVTVVLLFTSSIAAASVRSEPDNAFILIDIDDPAVSETYYGTLENFPHTYQFHVTATTSFSAQVASVGRDAKEATLSLILVKEKRRGVDEIARKRAEGTHWETRYDYNLMRPFVEGEVLTAQLPEGVYKLEVSTPDNLSPYQLRINGGNGGSYKELFMVRTVFGGGLFSLFFSWRILIPVLFVLIAWQGYRRYNNREHA